MGEVEIIEVINQPMVNSWLTSLKTTGLIIVAFTAIIITLAKTGVFAKMIDWAIQKKGLSTGFNKEVLKKIDDTLVQLLENDEQTKKQMAILHNGVEDNKKSIEEIKTDVKEVKIESLKKSVMTKNLYLIDRMASGIRYMMEGCNHEVQDYLLNQLCFEDLVQWNGMCRALKATQYWKNEKDRPADWVTESPKRGKNTEVENENRQ